jgi:hypothetical protein
MTIILLPLPISRDFSNNTGGTFVHQGGPVLCIIILPNVGRFRHGEARIDRRLDCVFLIERNEQWISATVAPRRILPSEVTISLPSWMVIRHLGCRADIVPRYPSARASCWIRVQRGHDLITGCYQSLRQRQAALINASAGGLCKVRVWVAWWRTPD